MNELEKRLNSCLNNFIGFPNTKDVKDNLHREIRKVLEEFDLKDDFRIEFEGNNVNVLFSDDFREKLRVQKICIFQDKCVESCKNAFI